MRPAGFLHEAWLYRGLDEFLEGASAFVSEGVRRGDAVLIAVSAAKIDALRDALGGDHPEVRLVDIAAIGRNPAVITSTWCEFVDEHTAAGRTVRGIGEPIWPERTPDEIVECHRHEAALNLVFDDGPAWRLLCPYDTSVLDPSIVHDACRTHPRLTNGMLGRPSGAYHRDSHVAVFDTPLAPPDAGHHEFAFGAATVRQARALIAELVADLLSPERLADLTLAVSELATNSVIHGGGEGVLVVWRDEHGVVCEVRDAGLVADPLAGRRRAPAHQRGGRGLWIANQLCDLVQLRSGDSGTVVRLRMRHRAHTSAG